MQDWRQTYQRILSLVQTGKLEKAFEEAERAVQTHTAIYPLWELFGVAARQTGRQTLAISALEHAVAIDPEQPSGRNNLGNARRDADQHEKAIQAYQSAIAIRPDYPEAHNNLGTVRRLLGDPKSAVASHQRAIALRPDYAEAHHNLGVALNDLARHDEAVTALRIALSLNPTLTETKYHLGNALLDSRRHDEAIASFRDAIESSPDFPEAHYNLANTLRDVGDLEQAANHYLCALRDKPQFAAAWQAATSLNEFPVNEDTLGQLQKLRQEPALDDHEQCEIRFALYQTYKRLNQPEEGFQYLQEANALRRQELGYQQDSEAAFFNKLKAEYHDWLVTSATHEPSLYRPIFIIGMPRSGTTLVEQIISSHSEVTGLGELPFARAAVMPLLNRNDTSIIERLSDLRSRYLEQVHSRLPTAGAFTDKMPQNALWLPMLAMALPEAKFVHVHRSPQATCWSLYERYFPARGLDYSYDLGDVAHYYQLYQDLMYRYASALGERIYHLSYETLTESLERETKCLTDYLGLAFEAAMLAPQANERTVLTQSNEQVRKPIYQGSSDAWRRFETQLQGAFDGLTPFRPDHVSEGSG